jgi:hypothetical protein
VFDFLVGGETVLAGGAFAAAADGRTFTRGTRINDLVILATAFGATHKTTANGGWLFVAHQALWRQGMPVIPAKASCVHPFSGYAGRLNFRVKSKIKH